MSLSLLVIIRGRLVACLYSLLSTSIVDNSSWISITSSAIDVMRMGNSVRLDIPGWMSERRDGSDMIEESDSAYDKIADFGKECYEYFASIL